MNFWQPAVELAAQLTAAGVRATTDPADAHPPVALVTPQTVTPLGGSCAVVELTVTIMCGGLDHSQLAWLWATALPTALEVVGLVDITADQAPDGTPTILLTVEQKVT